MMAARRANCVRRRQDGSWGGVLLEVVLSIALFGGAAGFALAAVQSVFATLERTRLQQEAIDLARSKIAELEAGLITLADIRSGETTDSSSRAAGAAGGVAWVFDLKSQRSEFTQLTLVELTVRQAGSDGAASDTGMRYTLRQLIHLGPNRGGEIEESSQEALGHRGIEGGST